MPDNLPHDQRLAQQVLWACLMEATARKPGNVHPDASFADLTYGDLVRSAEVVAPILARSRQRGIGRTILESVAATGEQVGSNANLGIILLLAPLAAANPQLPLEQGVHAVLDRLTVEDARLAYKAIRIANPGGLGRTAEQDVFDEPTGTLLEVMRLAADRDTIALQYATGFRLVLQVGAPLLAEASRQSQQSVETEADPFAALEEAIVRLALVFMSEYPDTLIARKRGPKEAEESARRAREILASGWPHSQAARRNLADFDRWLRACGNARNPGTTADLVAASLFAALREGLIERPAD